MKDFGARGMSLEQRGSGKGPSQFIYIHPGTQLIELLEISNQKIPNHQEDKLACVADGHRRVATKGRGTGEILQRKDCKISFFPRLPSPSSLFRSFSVSPLPKSNMAPRQTFHRNLRRSPATQATKRNT